jgi:archaellum component FlaF (FlaF/FlaG flagellin family)
MAITKTILKKVRQQAVVKFVGDGTANVDCNADVRLSDETFIGYGNANLNINTVYYNQSNTLTPITITRNGNVLFQLFGNDQWLLSQQSGIVDNTFNGANIVVTIPAPGGTVILGLTKAGGYTPPDLQALKDFQRP